MSRKKLLSKQFAIQIFSEITGSILVAAAIYNFAIQANFPMTGFAGISLILYRLFQIPVGLSTILCNIPVAVLCYRLLGKHFFISSLRCMVIYSFFMDYIAPLFPVYNGSRFLAALCTGVIGGIGYSIIYMQNSSTGGADFIILAIKAKKPHISLGKIAFLLDMGIILAGGIIFSDIDGIIYGMIINFLFAVMIDKIMYGINAGKLALIITENGNEICNIIDKRIGRGSTLLKAYGGYRGEKKQVVLCACNNREMYLVQKAIKESDLSSFLIILESNEVHGEGFRILKVGE